MKGESFSGLAATLPPAAVNGTHRTAKNGSTAKRPAGSRARADAGSAPQPVEAAFAITGEEPIDTPMWPRHAASWLQGERTPSVAVWTGLTIERQNRIPAPGFLHFEIAPEIAPMKRPSAIESFSHPLHPPVRLEFPQSGLAPLGWDPRAVCRRHEGE
jgi:hypothetical protein